MNIAFFLTPKTDVVWLPERATMAEALERLQRSGYTALPLLDDEGRYVGTLSEGDLLRKLTTPPWVSIVDAEIIPLRNVPRRNDFEPVEIDAEVEALFSEALKENFVPVVDSRDVFIGIVRRRVILEYCARFFTGAGQP